MANLDYDVAVIGGGIAGISVAAELSRHSDLRVAVLERESQLAYHASGRSAAAFLESYGSPAIRALTRASRPAFDTDERPLLTPRPLVWLAPEDQAAKLRGLIETEPLLREADEAEVLALCPVVRPGWSHLSAVEDAAQDLDVAGLFDHYRRLAVSAGVTVHTGASILGGVHDGTTWLLHTGIGDVRAATVVNAAGAWVDDVAIRCGLSPIGFRALRRTVALVTSPLVRRDWPLVADIGELFYFRPEGDGLLLSPADETPTEPVDARPETEDVALALDRADDATTLNLRHVRTSWAGLRTFSPDRNPVVGPDPEQPSFFWLGGQGGYGMQTAPAMAELAAALILDQPVPAGLADVPGQLSAARFRSAP